MHLRSYSSGGTGTTKFLTWTWTWCVKERSLQSRIVELESQLSQTRAEVTRQKRDKTEVIYSTGQDNRVQLDVPLILTSSPLI